MTTDLEHARIDLAAAFRLAVKFNFHEGICNHFSLALSDGRTAPDRFLINAAGLHWSEMSASSLLLVAADGQVLDGEGMVETTALSIHAGLHRAAPHAVCILHTHQPYATALGLIEGWELAPCEQNALRYHGLTAYDRNYNGLALDLDEGQRMADLLGKGRILFLAGHGVVVVGRSVAEAFYDLYYLERACQFQWLAMSTGRPLHTLSDDVIEKTVLQMHQYAQVDEHFTALKRVLDRDEPDYRS